MYHRSLLFLVILFLSSCGAQIQTVRYLEQDTLHYAEVVNVIDLDKNPPRGSKILGKVRIGDGGLTTDCDYYSVIERAKLESRKIGGNAIHITEHKFPDFGSTCHRIEADILWIEDPSSLDVETSKFRPMEVRQVNRVTEHDVIVRTNEQKVTCKIIDEDDDFVYFLLIQKDQEINTKLAKADISRIEYADGTVK